MIVIAVNEAAYAEAFNKTNALSVDGKTVDMETALRLAGCWDALATPHSVDVSGDEGRLPGQTDVSEGKPVRSAIAFCNTVKDSKAVESHWQPVTETVISAIPIGDQLSGNHLQLDVTHMDGSTPAIVRKRLLADLRTHSEAGSSDGEAEGQTRCRVLTNARVLAEGVDVPALDAVVFCSASFVRSGCDTSCWSCDAQSQR